MMYYFPSFPNSKNIVKHEMSELIMVMSKIKIFQIILVLTATLCLPIKISCESLHRYIITPQVVLDSMLACWSTRSSDGGECLTSSRENSCMGFLFLVYGLLPVWTIFEAYSLSEPKYPFKIRFSVFFSFKIDNICMYIYLWNNNIGLILGVEYVSNFEVLTDGCVS